LQADRDAARRAPRSPLHQRVHVRQENTMKLGALRRNISSNLINGALVLLPFLLSFYFLYWFAGMFDRTISGILAPFGLGKELPFGIGIAAGLAIIYGVGEISKYFVADRIKEWLERLIESVPILGSIFGSIRDITNYLKNSGVSAQGRAVIVTFENPGFKIAGFLTRSDLNTLPTKDCLEDLVAVYIPLAYMVGGGFTVFVHKNQVQDLEMPFDKAMQASLSAWMLKGTEKRNP
jgi:uncharacterized membrane protein